MSRVKLSIAVSAFFFVWLNVFNVHAQESKKAISPGDIVSGVTVQLLSTVKDKSSLLATNPDGYFKEVRDLLEPAIDFEYIAKNVMGRKSWQSIEEKDQLRFVDVFTDSLVHTYGKAMSSFVDLDIQVVKTWPSDNPKKKSYYVQQDVKLESGLAHIVYSMHPVAEGWMVRNVTIRDAKGYKLNMGKTFSAQFKSALSENKGDVVKTIDAWGK